MVYCKNGFIIYINLKLWLPRGYEDYGINLIAEIFTSQKVLQLSLLV